MFLPSLFLGEECLSLPLCSNNPEMLYGKHVNTESVQGMVPRGNFIGVLSEGFPNRKKSALLQFTHHLKCERYICIQ